LFPILGKWSTATAGTVHVVAPPADRGHLAPGESPTGCDLGRHVYQNPCRTPAAQQRKAEIWLGSWRCRRVDAGFVMRAVGHLVRLALRGDERQVCNWHDLAAYSRQVTSRRRRLHNRQYNTAQRNKITMRLRLEHRPDTPRRLPTNRRGGSTGACAGCGLAQFG
jgi:hypothetical protein